MTRLDVGDILEGRYRVDSPIAKGGMSTVYRCVDMRLGRAVAAKVMHEEFEDDPVFVQRFEREARAMARLQHSNLVGVHDFSADGEPIYLIMELIDGGTLRELLAEEGPLPPYAAIGVMRSVLAGLDEVHRTGLVHRDIKPDNVLITSGSRVKVGDFGLVRVSNAQVNSDHIVGTVSYLAPEQVTGEEITPAADVYSAGIVLFELLTGTVPFRGDTPLEHAKARLEEDVPTASSRIDGVPPLVDELVATATARDPEMRFADAGEFLEALNDVAVALHLPDFTVPVPQNAAAARTAARPTNFAGVGNTEVFNATTAIPAAPDEAPTDILDEGETEVFAQEEPQREALSFETRFDPPAAAPAPIPAPAQEWRAPNAGLPAQREQALPPTAEEEPAEKPVTNRSVLSLVAYLAVAVLLAYVVGLGAWWFGSTWYGATPALWR